MPPLTRFRERFVRNAGHWQAAAVLAPLLLLGALGMRGLQASRQDALDNARNEADRLLAQIEPGLRSSWATLQRDEVRRPLLTYANPPTPAPPDRAQTLYDEAIADADKSPAQAGETLAALERQFPDALSPAGLPLVVLAEWARLRSDRDPASLPVRARALEDAALHLHPSVLTPALMEGAVRLLEAGGVEPGPVIPAWVLAWKNAEAARMAYKKHEREIGAVSAPGWIAGGRAERWWVQPGTPPRYISKDVLTVLLYQRLPRLLSPPEYLALVISLDGVPLVPVTGETLARRDIEGLRVAAVLHDPERLYAGQRRQTLWLAALLLSALLAAGAAFLTMRRALAREQRLGQLKSDFVSSVSHELRAPVASMRLMADNLESGAVPTEKRRSEYHRLIAQECRRLSALIDNVLDFARIEQDRKTYDMAETDVTALVRDAIDFMQPRAMQRRQQIRAELTVIDPPPMCDGLAIRQALINLLDNAIKFPPESSAIDVRLRARDPETWEIAVHDEGPGIAPADHQVIFERFHRLGSELRPETQGAGIGLSIVRHIAQAHGGSVEIQSKPGEGSEFILVLPMAPAHY